jgi:uncharacterized membrane protein YhaH (DUF805 family)
MPYAPAAQPQSFEPPADQPWYGINFGKAIERFFKKYVVFSGRASKSEFWWAQLFLVLVAIAFSFLSGLTNKNSFIEFLSTAWSIAVFIPGLAVAVRRLHDANKPGALLLIPYALMFVGIILAAVGGLGTLFFGLASVGGSRSATQLVGSGVIAILFAVLLIIAGYVTLVVFMCMSTNPAGARFDRTPMPNPMAPMGGQAGNQAMPQASFQQQASQPYTPQTGQPYAPEQAYAPQPNQPYAPQNEATYGQQQPSYPQNPSYPQQPSTPSAYNPADQPGAQAYGQPTAPTQPYNDPSQDQGDTNGQSGQQFNPPSENPQQ